MPRRSWEDNMRQVLWKQYPNESTFSGNAEKFIRAVQAKHRGEPCGLGDNLKAVAMNCNDSQLTNVLPYLKNFSTIEYLSIRFIHDNSAEQLVSSLGALGVKTLVLADNCITQAGRDIVKQSLSKVPHEVFVSFVNANANSDRTGTAIFKDKSNKTYDMVIKSDGADAIIDFADNNTGISGVSAGDTCPPSVRDQIATCVGGGVGTVTATWTHCSSAVDVRAQLVCRGGAFFTGCASTVAAFATTQCARGEGLDSIADDSYRGFDANASQLSGASVDNNVSGNIGDFDLGSL